MLTSGPAVQGKLADEIQICDDNLGQYFQHWISGFWVENLLSGKARIGPNQRLAFVAGRADAKSLFPLPPAGTRFPHWLFL